MNLGHGTVVSLHRFRPNPPVVPPGPTRQRTSGRRRRHAPPRDCRAPSPGGPTGPAVNRPSGARWAESAPLSSTPSEVLRPTRELVPLAPGPGPPAMVRTQASPMLACDIFTVDAVLLKRLYVLFFIELDPRRAYVTGVAANPIGAWVVQQARNLSMVLATRTHPVRFLIRDRDTEFTSGLDDIFRSEGIWIIRTPVRAPRANALAERFVGTVRREGLDRMLIFGRHLERVLADHVAHYDEHRPHRALDQQPPLGVDEPLLIGDPEPSQFRRRDTVFGLMHEYQLVA